MSVSVYVHFPYCLYKCHYCDFNSYATEAGSIPSEAYTQALISELEFRKKQFETTGLHFFETGSRLNTLFLGGGTPSLWEPKQLALFLKVLSQYFPFDAQTEITLEANPKTLTSEKNLIFKELGINRLSIGVQSLHEAYLSAFGRIHTANDALEVLQMVAQAGFQSWSADLMFGFPGQTLDEWKKDLAQIVQFGMPHLSCYAFTVEANTPYASKLKKGEVSPPDSDLQTECFEWTREFLRGARYFDYEVSNFCRPGFESQHNLNYWNYKPYLGLGAGAVSFLQGGSEFGYRTTNEKEPRRYLQGVKTGELFQTELISAEIAQKEFLMMGLRLTKGVNEAQFQNWFGKPIREAFPGWMERFQQKGWLKADQLAVTPEGRLFLNTMLEEVF